MKNSYFLFTVLFLLLANTGFTQKKSATPEQKAQMLTGKMTKFYSLNKEQKNKISVINLAYVKELSALNDKFGKDVNGRAAAKKTLQDKYDQDVLLVLNKTQKEKYKKEVIKRNKKQAKTNKE